MGRWSPSSFVRSLVVYLPRLLNQPVGWQKRHGRCWLRLSILELVELEFHGVVVVVVVGCILACCSKVREMRRGVFESIGLDVLWRMVWRVRVD